MERVITRGINIMGLAAGCLCVIYSGVIVWLALGPQIKTGIRFIQGLIL